MSSKLAKRRKEPTTALATKEPKIEFNTANPIGQLLNMMTTKGVTPEALEKTLAVFERMEDRRAEQEFAVAFAALQADVKRIKASKPVPNNDGTIRYFYAPYESIMEEVSPALTAHGFGITFSTDYQGNPQRVIAKCTLTHKGGHSKTTEFAARVGSGPPKASEAQADGAATTYAKRFALCNALNIVVERDSDARNEGEKISAEEARAIEARVSAAAKGDKAQVARLLRLGGAKAFAEMHRAGFNVLTAHLDGLEQAPAPAVNQGTADEVIDPKKSEDEGRAFIAEQLKAKAELRAAVKKWSGVEEKDVSAACRSVFARMKITGDPNTMTAVFLRNLTNAIELTAKDKKFTDYVGGA